MRIDPIIVILLFPFVLIVLGGFSNMDNPDFQVNDSIDAKDSLNHCYQVTLTIDDINFMSAIIEGTFDEIKTRIEDMILPSNVKYEIIKIDC